MWEIWYSAERLWPSCSEMAKRTGDSESDLPQKRGRFEDPGTPHRLEMSSFSKRRLRLQQVSPRWIRMQKIKSSPLRRAIKTKVLVLKPTRKALSSPLKASDPLHLRPHDAHCALPKWKYVSNLDLDGTGFYTLLRGFATHKLLFLLTTRLTDWSLETLPNTKCLEVP